MNPYYGGDFMNQKEFRVYNMILPIWLLLWFPSPLWLLLIPANFLLDLLVIWLSIRKEENGFAVAWKNSGKICIAGFVSDFIGMLILFGTYFWSGNVEAFEKFNYALVFNPFKHAGVVVVILISIIVSGICIYKLDKRILRKSGELSEELIHKTALRLAIFTAPYLYFLPVGWFYN